MAKYEKGILGPFNGKVGPVVGSSWKGIDIMKSKSKRSNKTPSQAQLVQQSKFSLVAGFINGISSLLKNSFKAVSGPMSEMNSALRYHLEHAITGTYPAFTLDYVQVLVSKGQLLNATNTTAAAAAGGNVQFNWTDNSGIAMADATDKSILVTYCPALKRFAFNSAGPGRSAGTANLDASVFNGQTVHTWIGFISADGKEAATSIYTGQVVIV
ncbi:MAG TPA: DUF6266 family protein [Ferruginibacter sp.]|nr:DUF6266 family protein [Ferruginibacter sp.]